MGPRMIPDGQDFSASNGDFPSSFGFSGSSQGYDGHPVAPPFAGTSPTKGPHTSVETTPQFAKGGSVHPMGHQVATTEQRHDGSVVMHHAHGGYTVCHADGGMTHHGHDGQPMMAGGGGVENMHDSSELAHRATGGTVQPYAKGGASYMRPGSVDTVPSNGRSDDATQSRRYRHETGEEGKSDESGEASGSQFARGGSIGHRQHLPRGMKPKAGHFHPLGEESALNRPPRNPMNSTTPRNAMPGGQMPYGVQPSAEPDSPAPSDMTQLRRGGRVKRMEN